MLLMSFLRALMFVLLLLLLLQRWFLYPPDKQPHFHPNHSTLSWVRETYPSLPEEEAPLECTIRPGEVTAASFVLWVR